MANVKPNSRMSKKVRAAKPIRRRSRRGTAKTHASDLALSFLGVRSIDDVRIERVTSRHIARVLDATNGNLSLTATLLGINRRTMQRYMRRRSR
jgi:transcriptional regulator of acetoin/glycerol metabolism